MAYQTAAHGALSVVNISTRQVTTMSTPLGATVFGFSSFGFGAGSGDLFAIGAGAEQFNWTPETGALLGEAAPGSRTPYVPGHGDAIATCVDHTGSDGGAYWEFTDPVSGAPVPGISAAIPCSYGAKAMWLTESSLVETEAGTGAVINLRSGRIEGVFASTGAVLGVNPTATQILEPDGQDRAGLARVTQTLSWTGTPGGLSGGPIANPSGTLVATSRVDSQAGD